MTEPTQGGIVVAIPVLNEAAHIAEVYHQLSRDLPTGRSVRFLVLDGGSTDGTPDIVADLARRTAGSSAPVELVANPARFQSAAINLAASRMTAGEAFLVRADAHAGYPAGFVARTVASLEETGAASVVVPMDSAGLNCVGRAIAWVSDTRVGSGGSAHRGGVASGPVDHGHHAAWRAAAFREAGGYDLSFTHNEDAELDCRLRRMGGVIWLDAGIRITYFVRRSLAALFRQYRNYGHGRSRTVRRHPGTMRGRQMVAACFLPVMAAACVLAFVSTWALLLPGLYVAILAATSLKIAVERRSACGLLAGSAALVMHAAWSLGFIEGVIRTRQEPWSAADGAAA